jgi:hypothetical protein
MLGYVLEVCRFICERDGENGWLNKGGKYEHVGYMNALFKSKKDACSYYDRHNPHMRGLNAHNTYQSDWDPDTKLFYIVRENHSINATIPPFSEDDLPVVIKTENNVKIEYKYLK